MKKIYFLFTLTFLTFFSKSQIVFDWAHQMDQTEVVTFGRDLRVYDMESDASGNIYVVGIFKGTVDFNTILVPGGVLTAFGTSEDPFIAKYDASGNYLWAQKISNPWNPMGDQSNDRAVEVAVDAGGNAYVAGDMYDGGLNGFMARYTAAGTLSYILDMPGYTNRFTSERIATDNAGNVYMTNLFDGTEDLNPGAGVDNHTSGGAGVYNIYIAKFVGATGAYVWGESFFSTTNNYVPINIKYEPISDQLYLGGGYMGTVDFDPNAGVVNRTSPSGTFNHGFVAKYNATTGAYIAVRTFGNATSHCRVIDLDVAGNDLYVHSEFTGTVDLDWNAGTANVTDPRGPAFTAAALSKYDKTTLNLDFAQATPYLAGYVRLVAEPSKVLLHGRFINTQDFDPGAGVFNLTDGPGDTWAAYSLDNTGAFLWASITADNTSSSFYNDVSWDNSSSFSRFFTAGDFADEVALDPSTIANTFVQGTGAGDGYVVRYTICSGGPAQPSTITGDATPCGGSETYFVTNVPGITYSWSYSGAGTASSTTSSVTFTPTGSGTLSVTATDACGTSVARNLSITVGSVPSTPSAPTGTTPICPSVLTTGYAVTAVAGATSYTWSYGGSGTVTPTGSPSGITASLTATTGGNLTVRAVNACGTSAASPALAVVVSPGTPGVPSAPTGPTVVCSGTLTTGYSVGSVANATSYDWDYTGTGTVTETGSPTGISASLNATSGGNLRVRAINSCGTSAYGSVLAVTVDAAIPATPGTPTGPSAVCTSTLTAGYAIGAVANATSYDWDYSGTGTVTRTGSPLGITASLTATTGGNLRVRAVNTCGTSAYGAVLVVTVDTGIPGTPGTPTGPSAVCSATPTTGYSIGAVAGATSYNWSYSGTGTVTETGSPLGISATLNATTAGNLTVQAVNACGSSSASAVLAVTVDAATPATPGAITGPTSVCRGASPLYSISAVTNATSYTWNYTGTGTASSSTTSVTFSPTTNGLLSVTANNACGTSSANSIALTIDTTFTPSIVSSGFDMCTGDSRTLLANPSGGTFSIVSGGAFASLVGNTLTGNAVGTVQIRYRITNACGNMDDLQNINIVSPSVASVTSSTADMCIGDLRGLTGTPLTGSWSVISGPGYIGVNDTLISTNSGTVQVEYQYISPCGITADTVSITVNPDPVVIITSSGLDMCIGDTRALTGTPVSGTWNVLSGPGSLIGSNLTTSGAGTIQIEYTGSALGCSESTTQNITVVGSSDATWVSPDSLCENTGLIDLTTYLPGTSTTGGVWSGSPNISGGGILNTTGLGGTTINVKYKVGVNPCQDSLTLPIVITNTPDASWTIPSTVCENEQFDLDTLLSVGATTGGTWSILSGGGSIVGSIYTPANVTSNTSASIRYLISASAGCPAISNDESFTVNNVETVTNTTSTANICENQPKSLSASPSGGTWSIVSGGGSILGQTYTPANISLNTVVTIRYIASNNGNCLGDSADVSFTVNSDTTVINNTSSSPICSSDTKLLSGTPLGGTWSIISGGGSIAGSTYTPAAIVTPTNVTIRYTYTNGLCVDFQDIAFTVNPIASQPNITAFPIGGDTVCINQSVNLTANIVGAGTIAWYDNNNPQPFTASGIPLAYGGTLTVNPNTDTTYYAFGESSQGCRSLTYDSINVFTFSPSVSATSITATLDTVCSGQSTTLTLSGGSLGKNGVWTWYETGCGMGTSIGTGISITVSPSSNESYFVRAEGLCDTTTCVQFDVIVNNSVDATWTNPDSVCIDAGIVNLNTYLLATSTSGGSWSGTGVVDSLFNPQINGLGMVSITYTIGSGPCVDALSQNIRIYSPSQTNVSDDVLLITSGNLDTLDVESNDITSGTITITLLPKYGSAYVSGNRILYIADSNYRGYDTLYYSVCDYSCANTCDTAQIVLRIEKNVFDNPDNGNIGIWGVSPNADGINDVLYIDDLYSHPNNKITIYNRWGDEIYTASPYVNDWNGTDYVMGHYFFVLEFLDSEETFKGIIYLKK